MGRLPMWSRGVVLCASAFLSWHLTTSLIRHPLRYRNASIALSLVEYLDGVVSIFFNIVSTSVAVRGGISSLFSFNSLDRSCAMM